MRPSDVYEYAKHFPFSAWSSPSLYLEIGEVRSSLLVGVA